MRLLGSAVGEIANYPDCVQCRMSLSPLPRSVESSDTEELEEQLQTPWVRTSRLRLAPTRTHYWPSVMRLQGIDHGPRSPWAPSYPF